MAWTLMRSLSLFSAQWYRRSVLLVIVLLLISGNAAAYFSETERETEDIVDDTISSNDNTQNPPNILILFADNLGYNDIGTYGAPTAQTPNIDRLADEGLKFTHWNSAAHLCSASRAALLTGQYPVRQGIYPGVFHPDASSGLPPPSPQSHHTTIAKALKQRGYATSIVGKWHLGHLPEFLPTTHMGFDEWLGIPYHMSGGSVDHHTCAADTNETLWLPLYHNDQILQQPVQLSQLASRYEHQATQFIRRHHIETKNPWFLYMSFSHVHNLCAPRDFPEQETCQWNAQQGPGASFVDAVQEMDAIAGKILNTLDELNIANNTLVLFTSDNGPWVAEQVCSGSKGPFEGRWLIDHAPTHCTACPHDYVPVELDEMTDPPYISHTCRLPSTNQTLQGVPCGHDTGLGSVWEANLRMPALVRWPGRIQARRVTNRMVSTLDVLPTILSIVDGDEKREKSSPTRQTSPRGRNDEESIIFDGVDLTPLLMSNDRNTASVRNTTILSRLEERPLFFWRDGYRDGPLPQPYGRVDVAAVKLGRLKFWFSTKSAHYNDDPDQDHDPPLIFDVLADPAEAYPLSPEKYAESIAKVKQLVAEHKNQITIGNPLTLQRDEASIPCADPENRCRTKDDDILQISIPTIA